MSDYAKPARDYPAKPVPFTSVRLTDAFWAPRIETNRTVSIPCAFRKCEETGRVATLTWMAALQRGEKCDAPKLADPYPFDETDVYKIIEGASYSLSVHPDAELDTYLDRTIADIAGAQEPDGYIYSGRLIRHPWAGRERWELERELSHELYNLGHLFEAAVAHHLATGKRTLLDVAIKAADMLDRTFGPGKRAIWAGHQIVEMGLAKLYRVTGDGRYINLARFLLDVHGPDGARGGGSIYNQSHEWAVEQSEAVGHAVRAVYMYSGMADVAALAGEEACAKAIDRIWNNMVSRKLYITGGIGATAHGEAFGADYELPNQSAYCETCAAIGNVYWNHRMFLLHLDARCIDVVERALYNGLISGVSLDGKSYFYPNPLESSGQHQRSEWFGCSCCPSNITRFMASIPGYVYAQSGETLYVNLFASSTAEIAMDAGRTVTLVQETRYPWDGKVRITVKPDRSRRFTINVRMPGWARDEVVPSDLYSFTDEAGDGIELKVNGTLEQPPVRRGYAALLREWRDGDVIEMNLPMPVRRVVASEHVAADRGRVALQRGPIVFCAEWPDNPDGRVRNLMLPDQAALTAEFHPDRLGGVIALTGKAVSFARNVDGTLAKREQDFTAIPYYAWAHRGPGEMTVWLPNTPASVRPIPAPSIASTSTVRASVEGDLKALNDQEEPASSSDTSRRYTWHPKKGTTEWAEYVFAAPAKVSEVEVYWFDDTGHGECRLPECWQVLYRDGEEWKPVTTSGGYSIEKDRFNKVAFKRVLTNALRLEVKLQPGFSAGVLEWRVK